MSDRQLGWAKSVVGILLVVVPAFFVAGAIATGAAVLGVFLIVTGVKQLRSLSASQPRGPLTSGRSRLFRIVGWLLVVPLVAALVFGIVVLASVDPNEETESIERVMAAVFVILAIPLAWGGWVMIRRRRKPSISSDPKPA
jgi:lysylphosphatidylglycerol synthetase-like protein (DUF2156 family)